ncbi:unnamed protein product [Pedinophyceae sp. YPF-701]|nr:unnamed protein product [Pedinophyceae sp. YPF-701]
MEYTGPASLRSATVRASSNGGPATETSAPPVSQRVQDTDAPCIVKTKALMASAGRPVASLAQGVVHWAPPPAALEAATNAMSDPRCHGYGPAEGLPELREALVDKLEKENGLTGYDVMVTAGANQAFTNLVLALTDADDGVVLFRPYYFNHLMAIQMTGGARNIILGDCDATTQHPDLAWLRQRLESPNPPKMVVIVNPCNPTGVLLSRAEVEEAAELCRKHNVWLVLDDTYEHFVYGEGSEHACPPGPNVIHVFSFSKAFGMMGWRVGYIAYPTPELGAPADLGAEILKVQDTIPICATTASQLVALGAVRQGREWVQERVDGLAENRAVVLDALSPLGSVGDGIAGGEGAIYVWGRLPDTCTEHDEDVVAWLVREHGVCTIAGSSCGCPGFIRVAFANLEPKDCAEAAGRLKSGLQELVRLAEAGKLPWAQ